ncbi:MAG: hypothetical protein HND51_01270 [Chloroflexi bacterium]|nr:hypothetical protein [Chloroflexota bacterium]
MLSKHNLRIILYLCWLGVLVACATNANKPVRFGDGGLISSEPCGPPCFWSITLGMVYEDAIVALDSVPGVDSSFCKEVSNNEIISFQCKGLMVSATNEDPTHREVILIRFEMQETVTVAEVLAKHGVPDYASIGSNLDPHFPVINMSLLYNEYSAYFGLESQDALETDYLYELHSETSVKSVQYLTDEVYSEAASLSGVEWIGYGLYESQPLNFEE